MAFEAVATRRLIAVAAVSALASSCASRYETLGMVLAVDPASAQVTVSHEAVPGFMDAMAMPFDAADAHQLAGVGPGDRIAFRINVQGDRTWIDRVRILSAAPADAGLAVSPAVPTLVPIGGAVPDFTLTDQRGGQLPLSSLRGKVVAASFIYTRCPLPDYCPRVMANLDAVRDRFADRLGRDLALLTITFDPKFDSPEALRAYAAAHAADVPGWHFLTGTADEIGRVCGLFGVEFWPEEGLITHTLRTVVIDRDGRLAATVEGRGYSGRQLADLIGRMLEP